MTTTATVEGIGRDQLKYFMYIIGAIVGLPYLGKFNEAYGQEMLLTAIVFAALGTLLRPNDDWFNKETPPLFTVGLLLIGALGALLQALAIYSN